MEEKTVSILGDCNSQAIAGGIKHVRAVGLLNWLSIASGNFSYETECVTSLIRSMEWSEYIKRTCILDISKKALDYLLEEKADYLIIDCTDFRKGVYLPKGEVPTNIADLHCITNSPNLTNFHLIPTAIWGGAYKEYLAYEFSDSIYKQAVDKVIEKILQLYRPNEIIVHRHPFAEKYTDGEQVFTFINNAKRKYTNHKVRNVVNFCYEYLIEKLEGCHVINELEHVLGDKYHRFNCMPLHYLDLYEQYGKQCLKIIFEHHVEEKELLELLRKNYSQMFFSIEQKIESTYRINQLEKRLNLLMYQKVIPCRQALLKINNMEEYLDALYLYRENIAVFITVKDTPGNVPENVRYKLSLLGFKNYPGQLWKMYAGCSYGGKTIIDRVAEQAEIPVVQSFVIGSNIICLESHSYRKTNTSICKINDVDYSLKTRGMNLVVFDLDENKVIDSICYDSHDVQTFFSRREW